MSSCPFPSFFRMHSRLSWQEMKQSDGRVITWAYGCQISSDKIREIFVHQFIHANSPRSATVYSTYMIEHRGPKNPVVHVTITQREGGISIRCPTGILV